MKQERLQHLATHCVLTIEQIKDIRRLLPSDKALEKICDLSNSYGYGEIRKKILTGELNTLLQDNQ